MDMVLQRFVVIGFDALRCRKSLSESISDRPLTSIAIHCVRQLTQADTGEQWVVGGGIRDGNEPSCLRFNVCFRFLHFLLKPELSHPWRTGSNPA